MISRAPIALPAEHLDAVTVACRDGSVENDDELVGHRARVHEDRPCGSSHLRTNTVHALALLAITRCEKGRVAESMGYGWGAHLNDLLTVDALLDPRCEMPRERSWSLA
jgi:hypothetical protein